MTPMRPRSGRSSSARPSLLGTQKRIDVIFFDGLEWSPEAKAFITVGNVAGSTAAPVLDLDANNSNGGGADYTATFTSGGPPDTGHRH